MKIAILHAYSAANAGDGLLVEESIRLIREAFGPGCRFVVAASDPASFAHLDARVVDARPRRFGYERTYLRLLRSLDDADLVVGVGGGYLRAGRPIESAKTALVHLPQLVAAARARTLRLYLPQSIGPASPGAHRLLRTLLEKLDVVLVRDDRTLVEFGLPNMARVPDLALLKPAERSSSRVPGRPCSGAFDSRDPGSAAGTGHRPREPPGLLRRLCPEHPLGQRRPGCGCRPRCPTRHSATRAAGRRRATAGRRRRAPARRLDGAGCRAPGDPPGLREEGLRGVRRPRPAGVRAQRPPRGRRPRRHPDPPVDRRCGSPRRLRRDRGQGPVRAGRTAPRPARGDPALRPGPDVDSTAP